MHNCEKGLYTKGIVSFVFGVAVIAGVFVPSYGAAATAANEVLISGAAQVNTGSCTAYTVKSQTSAGAIINFSATHPITLSASGVGGSFYTNSTCTTVGSPQFGPKANPITVYFKASATVGSGTLTASTPIAGFSAGTVAVASSDQPELAISGPSNVITGSCSVYSVSASDSQTGAILNLGYSHGVNLSQSGVSGTFYLDSACSKTGTFSVGPNANPAKVYFKAGSAAGKGSLTAGVTGWLSGSQNVSLAVQPKLAISGASSVSILSCDAYSVSANDANTGALLALSASEGVSLSESGVGGAFYSDSACSKSLTQVTLSSTVNPATVYFKPSATAGSGSLSATSTGSLAGSFSYQSTLAGKLVMSGPASVAEGSCAAYSVTADNPAGSAISFTSANSFSVSASGVSGTIYLDSACSKTGSPSFGAGANPVSIYFKASAAGSGSLTSSMTGFSSASASLTAIQPKLVLSAPASAAVGTCSAMSITPVNGGTGASLAPGYAQSVSLAISGLSGGLYSDAACTKAITQISVGPTAVAVPLYFKAATTPSQGSIAATAAGWVSASASLAVIPGAPAKLAFANQLGSVIVGKTMPPLEVKVLDSFGNLVTGSVSVTVSAVNSSSGAVALSGTTSESSVAGLATFSSLSTNYNGMLSLVASASGLPSVTSNSFGVYSVPIGGEFFGMHMMASKNWPTVPIGAYVPNGTTWYAIETKSATGVISYNFSGLDGWLNAQKQLPNQYMVSYNILHTPQWDASNPTQPCSGSTTGCASPPKDLNSDGSGTDQLFINYITALVQHSVARKNAGLAGIDAYQLWNEPNGPNFGNPSATTSSGFFSGTYAQLARMGYDLYTIVKKYDPSALVVTPAPAEPGYPCIGSGGTSGCAQNWMAAFLSTPVYGTTQKAGAFFDVGAWHGYMPVYNSTPDPLVEEIVPEVTGMRAVLDANEMAGKPLWDSEGGWGVNAQLPDAGQQADFVSRWLILQAANGVNLTMWYDWDADPSLTVAKNWGTMFDPSTGVVNSAGEAFAQVQSWLSGASFLPCTSTISATSNVWACDVLLSDGAPAQLVWTSESTYAATAQFSTAFKSMTNMSGVSSSIAGGVVTVSATPVLLK